jgi:hypothetical protein
MKYSIKELRKRRSEFRWGTGFALHFCLRKRKYVRKVNPELEGDQS